MRRIVLHLTAAALLGCSGGGGGEPSKLEAEEGTLLRDPLAEFPERFSDVGLYPRAPDLSVFPSVARSYEPGYALWSDGGSKERFLVLPEGSAIDAEERDAWRFPVGTLLFKTFFFRTQASGDEERPVETRVMRLGEDDWEFAAYGWNEAGDEAELLSLRTSEPREVSSEGGEPFEHSIPSRLECRQCHESTPGRVLGVNELSLSASGDLAELSEALAPAPAAPFADLGEHGPKTKAVLGYFVGNCVHCHNGGQGAATSFDLRPDVALENIIDAPTESSASAAGIRVVPGKPEESVLLLAMRGGQNGEVKDMPPLGVARRDARGIALVEDFIRALGEEEDP